MRDRINHAPVVSFLHTGETVPGGSDPVSGKSETSFCFVSTAAGGTERNHKAVAARAPSSGTGTRRYGWCIIPCVMMIDAYGRNLLDMARVGG